MEKSTLKSRTLLTKGEIMKVTLTVAFVCTFVVLFAFGNCAYADVFETAKSTATSIFEQVKGIGTALAALSIAVCMITSFFSHSQKTVESTRTIAKNVFISWIVLMCVGYIFEFANSTSLISDAPGIDTLE